MFQRSTIAAVLTGAALFATAAPAGAHDEGEYVVRPGDTLSVIARQVQATIQTLVALNSITDPDRIVVGQRLRLPGGDVAPGAAPAPTIHVVQRGDTLSEVAKRYGVPLDALAAANGISDVNRVWVGTRLTVAAQAPALPGPAAGLTHVVAPGETLSEIAARYGVTVGELAAANGIADPNVVIAGATLSVPGGWRCPAPEVSRFIDDFGIVKVDGRYHDGVDLFALRGSPVVAPVGGVVQQVEGRRGGRQFVLDGDDGHRYIGTHMDSFGAGGQVAAGAVLGTVGDSGNARGSDPHLHFEIHPGGGPAANPYPVLEVACRH